jgi:pyruvate,water dikinase
MRDYGARGYREIDIATPRSYEDLITFFLRLKDINLEDSKLATTEERRDEAYNKLLSVAQQGGFEKKFRKQADIYETLFGYREDTKYIIVLGIAKLRKAALTKGELLVSQGRLAHPNDIFDLTIAQIQRAETDDSFDLRATRDLNLKPYKMTAHVKQWPLVIDSRGKIFRATKRSEDGDLIGDPIAPGVIKGRAKVLLSPHEKPLEPGEILVTMATEPSWTPIFGTAAGVVMEVGGSLHHGAIIAREYGLPCVSGLTGATTLIKDGDLIEVDGSNGIVRMVEAV